MSRQMIIVDPHVRDRENIAGYFRRQGFQVEESGDAREGQALVRARYFPVVLVDADVEPWGGLEFVSFVRTEAPRTAVVMLTTKRTWEIAVGGFRRGAVDVVLKDAAEASRLLDAVNRAVGQAGGGAGAAAVSTEARQLLDDLLARMMDMSRQIPATQSRLATVAAVAMRVAVVDHESDVAKALTQAAVASRQTPYPFQVAHLQSGGTALDVLSSAPPDVLVAREDLADLPATTLLAALQSGAPEMSAVVYRAPGPDAEAVVYDKGHPVRTLRPLPNVAPLLGEVSMLVERAAAGMEQRRLMDLFRKDNAELLRRYASIRSSLADAGRAGDGGG